jgi:hypothetical protein
MPQYRDEQRGSICHEDDELAAPRQPELGGAGGSVGRLRGGLPLAADRTPPWSARTQLRRVPVD